MNTLPAILTYSSLCLPLLRTKKVKNSTMPLMIGFLALSPPYVNPLNRFLTGLSKKQGLNLPVKSVLPMGFGFMSSAD